MAAVMMIQPQTPLQPVTDTAQQREMLELVTEPELAMETKQQRLLLEPKLKDTEREQAPELLIKQQGLEPVLQREMQPADCWSNRCRYRNWHWNNWKLWILKKIVRKNRTIFF